MHLIREGEEAEGPGLEPGQGGGDRRASIRKRGSEKQGLLGEQQLLRGKYTTTHLFSSAMWRHALEMPRAFDPAAPRWEKPVWLFSSEAL